MNLPQTPPASLSELIRYFSQDKAETAFDPNKNQQTFYIYEMGRGIKQLSNQLFADFEDTITPWPYPFLRSAWFALFFTDPENSEDYHVWFLKFPLDEQGKLVQAARDDFLKQFYNQIQKRQSNQTNKDNLITTDSLAAESPYGFKPSEEKIANINAIVKHKINKLPSKYYLDVLKYLYPQQLENKQQWDGWKSLGYQGLADLTCHMHNQYHEKIIEQQLADNIQFLPIEMLKALSTCLEHHQLSQALADALTKRALKLNQLDNMIACLRSISASNKQSINSLLKQALSSDYKGNIELLAVVCGRCWDNLQEPWLMQLFLEALARTETTKGSSAEAFNIMVNDLLFIPGMRETLLEQFRNPQRSTELTIAIGAFYSSTR
ncbi:MAG: DUF3549 family protein [Pseudomonadota bacterium]